METNKPVNPERQWIRLQEIGLCLALSIPIIIATVAYFVGYTIRGPTAINIINILIVLILLLGAGSFACIQYGAEKRQELKEERLKDEKMQEVWTERRPQG